MSRSAHRLPADLRSNLTPMIDIVFQLIIFFMVVAQITRHRAVELTPPMIEARQNNNDKNKTPPIVIHVIPGASAESAPAYRLNDELFERTDEGLAALARRVAESISREPGAEVHVRADRLEDYARVRPALEAARKGGASTVGLVTVSPGTTDEESTP
ncbi:MAG: biopolymer transporter ExbD [Phycisphaeraceae bacterium]|nr:biopolymer transporter ExbD [Phycisphaerales bacterium]MCB9842034.1 biopolymer transporter ExbD [Phycisphaeraceae bacterium]